MWQQNCTLYAGAQLAMRNKFRYTLILVATLVFLTLGTLIKNGNIRLDYRLHLPGIMDHPAQTISHNTTQPQSNIKIFFPIALTARSTFYVSPNGNDGNPGTLERPWRTISKAAREAFPGIEIYIRGGIYNELVEVRASGTEDKPIRFMAYSGEAPVIDGNHQLPAYWVGLFSMYGDWIRIAVLDRVGELGRLLQDHPTEAAGLAVGLVLVIFFLTRKP